MPLTNQQLNEFEELGYLFIPEVFSAQEIQTLYDELPGIFAQDRVENVREKGTQSVRTTFAAHTFNQAFGYLGKHPRIINPVRQILDGEVYMHQYKINAKAAYDGDVWQWHQDFGTWSRDDLMPEARAMNIAVFLDDVTEFNGALMFIPRSHRDGVHKAGHDLETTSYPLWTLDKDTVSRLVDEGGIVSPKGPAGSVIMFHSNLVHASPSNISPFDRTIVYLSLCHVDNHIRQFKRPEWIAHRDFKPIVPAADDCLMNITTRSA
jgi:ectoine hydroxylase